MKTGIETLDEVYANYGTIVGDATAKILVDVPDASLAPIVDALTEALEASLTVLGFTFERKPGF